MTFALTELSKKSTINSITRHCIVFKCSKNDHKTEKVIIFEE